MRPFLLGTLLALAGCAPMPVPTDDAPARLAASESAFAAQSMREGMRAAFLAWLAPGATMFRDGPIDGPARLAASPDPPIHLDWRPVYVETASSGDLGLSTGPWRRTSRTDASKPPAFGQFVSVWKRDAGGAWRVAVDLGISHEGPVLWDAPLEARPVPPPGSTGGTIAEAEAEFARIALAQGHATAYGTLASASMRAYRDGLVPFLGRDALLASVAATGHARWTLDRHETSAAGDLGYAIGRFGPAAGGKGGDFLRIWRREPGGWRIALDVTDDVKPK